jgi:hypothetical protein
MGAAPSGAWGFLLLVDVIAFIRRNIEYVFILAAPQVGGRSQVGSARVTAKRAAAFKAGVAGMPSRAGAGD